MLDYREVVKERYDSQELSNSNAWNSGLYSFCNAVGFYSDLTCMKVLYDFYQILRKEAKFIQMPGCKDKMKVLDVGCGMGTKTRAWAELLGNSDQVYGFEFSENRLEHCKNMNDKIHYEFGDMVKGIPFECKFAAASAFVVLMHLREEKDILSALSNIYHSLEDRGFFLWYECNTKSHFISSEEADGNGYSAAEMDKYALMSGFVLVKSYGIHKVIKGNSTVYWANKLPMIILDLISKCFPAKYGNLVRIYQKL